MAATMSDKKLVIPSQYKGFSEYSDESFDSSSSSDEEEKQRKIVGLKADEDLDTPRDKDKNGEVKEEEKIARKVEGYSSDEEYPEGPKYVSAAAEKDKEIVTEEKVNYVIKVYTGDKFSAGTNARVYLSIYGDNGNSTEMELSDSNNFHMFERDQCDEFTESIKYLGKLNKIQIRHDNSGFGPGWYLKKVEIKDSKNQKQYTFPVKRWLDKNQGDHNISLDVSVSEREGRRRRRSSGSSSSSSSRSRSRSRSSSSSQERSKEKPKAKYESEDSYRDSVTTTTDDAYQARDAKRPDSPEKQKEIVVGSKTDTSETSRTDTSETESTVREEPHQILQTVVESDSERDVKAGKKRRSSSSSSSSSSSDESDKERKKKVEEKEKVIIARTPVRKSPDSDAEARTEKTQETKSKKEDSDEEGKLPEPFTYKKSYSDESEAEHVPAPYLYQKRYSELEIETETGQKQVIEKSAISSPKKYKSSSSSSESETEPDTDRDKGHFRVIQTTAKIETPPSSTAALEVKRISNVKKKSSGSDSSSSDSESETDTDRKPAETAKQEQVKMAAVVEEKKSDVATAPVQGREEEKKKDGGDTNRSTTSSSSSSESETQTETDTEKKAKKESQEPPKVQKVPSPPPKKSSSSSSSGSDTETQTETDTDRKPKAPPAEPAKAADIVPPSPQKEVKKEGSDTNRSSSSSSGSETETQTETDNEKKPKQDVVAKPAPIQEEEKKKGSDTARSSSSSSSDSDSETESERKMSPKAERSVSPKVTSPSQQKSAKTKKDDSSSSDSDSNSDTETQTETDTDRKPKPTEKVPSPPPPAPVVTQPVTTEKKDAQDEKKKASDTTTSDSSSDSSSSSGSSDESDDEDKKKKKTGDKSLADTKGDENEKKETDASIKTDENQYTNLPSESDGEKKISVFESESDADNMHGGHDPDNIINGGSGPSSRLVKIGVKPGQPHDGSIANFVSGKPDIELNNISLNNDQVSELVEYLEKSDNIRTISFRNTQLDNEKFTRLSEAIRKSPSKPLMLNFNLNKITAKSAEKLVEIVREKPSVEILLLHGNPLGSDGIKLLVDGMLQNGGESSTASPGGCRLKELDVGDTNLGNTGVEELSRLLEQNTDLKTLNINGNPAISYVGWRRLGKALKINKNLTHLTLDFNKIGDEGISALVKGLKDNLTLKSLDLEDTGLMEDGGRKIVELLKSNTAILEITVSPGNFISEKTQDEIRNYLSLNKTSFSAQ